MFVTTTHSGDFDELRGNGKAVFGISDCCAEQIVVEVMVYQIFDDFFKVSSGSCPLRILRESEESEQCFGSCSVLFMWVREGSECCG